MKKSADIFALKNTLLQGRIAKERDEAGILIKKAAEDTAPAIMMSDFAVDDIMEGEGKRLPGGLCDRILGSVDDLKTSQDRVASALEEQESSAEEEEDTFETCCCRVCGHKAGNLKKHLANEHDLSSVDYTNVFPSARVRSQAVEEAYAARSVTR